MAPSTGAFRTRTLSMFLFMVTVCSSIVATYGLQDTTELPISNPTNTADVGNAELNGKLSTAPSTRNSVELENNEYQNVYMAISPELEDALCNATVKNFKEVINLASQLLFDMTDKRVYFPTLFTIVIPASFSSCGDNNASVTGWQYSQAPIRVGPTHPLFGNNIWTQQPQSCGLPGDFIQLTPQALKDKTFAARRLASEWAKYRWGILEESGHDGDAVYPPAFTGPGGYLPTACSNAPLNYTAPDCTEEQSCSIDLDPLLNTAPTTSILSLPHLPNVVSMCRADTHDKGTPTKQNLLCDGRSAWEIYKQHSDFVSVGPLSEAPPIAVEVVRETPVVSSVVFAVEYNKQMNEYNFQLPFLRDALCQAILSYLQEGVYLGLVFFDEGVTSEVDLTLLDTPDARHQLCAGIMNLSTPQTNTTSLREAIRVATNLLPAAGGQVVLITRYNEQQEDLAAVVTEAGSNRVSPLLYPYSNEDSKDWFTRLAYETGGEGPRVVERVMAGGNDLSTLVRTDLSVALRDTIGGLQEDQMDTITTGSCSTPIITSDRSCVVDLVVGDAGATADGFFVSAYFERASAVTLGPETVRDFCTGDDTSSGNGETSYTYYCDSLPEEVTKIQVTIETWKNGRQVYGELVSLEHMRSNTSSRITVWSNTTLRDLQYTDTTAPAVFAKVHLSGRQVFGATVQARAVVQGGGQGGGQGRDRVGDLVENLVFRDNGIGADMTGSDGIYSSFLSGVWPNSSVLQPQVTLHFSATGPAYLLTDESTSDPPNVCCGSSLNLPPVLEAAPDFLLNFTSRARVTSLPAGNLPPGRVMDLRASTVGSNVRLTFTAPGADIDSGTVSTYMVKISDSSLNLITSYNVSNGLVASGSTQSIEMSKDLVGCDMTRSYAVIAYDEQNLQGGASNSIRYSISCQAGVAGPLQAGTIVGIVIGCIILFLIICLLLYIGCNWKNRDDLTVWQCLTCGICMKDSKTKSADPYKTTLRSRQEREDRARQVKGVNDLYTVPDMKKKHQTRQQSHEPSTAESGVDNGGFVEIPLRGPDLVSSSQHPPISSSFPNDSSSFSSFPSNGHDDDFNIPYNLRQSTLQTTLPINNVGIPVGDFNDDSGSNFIFAPIETNAVQNSVPLDYAPIETNAFQNSVPYGDLANDMNYQPRNSPPDYSVYPPYDPSNSNNLMDTGHSSPTFVTNKPRLNTQV